MCGFLAMRVILQLGWQDTAPHFGTTSSLQDAPFLFSECILSSQVSADGAFIELLMRWAKTRSMPLNHKQPLCNIGVLVCCERPSATHVQPVQLQNTLCAVAHPTAFQLAHTMVPWQIF